MADGGAVAVALGLASLAETSEVDAFVLALRAGGPDRRRRRAVALAVLLADPLGVADGVAVALADGVAVVARVRLFEQHRPEGQLGGAC